MFGNYMVSIKVRLNSDLSYYFPGLTCGIVGYTLGNAYKSDTYTAVIDVYFEEYGVATVVLDKLDIIDEEYLAFLKKKEKEFLKQLESAHTIEKKIGPKGGFKNLRFICSLGELSFYEKSKAERIEKVLKELGKEIKEVVIN